MMENAVETRPDRPWISYAQARRLAGMERARAIGDFGLAWRRISHAAAAWLRSRLRGGSRNPEPGSAAQEPGRRSQNTAPLKEKTSSPFWFTPTLWWNTKPQPGRDADTRLPVNVER